MEFVTAFRSLWLSRALGAALLASTCAWTPAIAATVPFAPTAVYASGANAQAIVKFTAPASDGGEPITSYTVVSNPAGGVDANAGTTSLTHVITGLANGTSYTFTVKATNAVDEGPASASSNLATPNAGLFAYIPNAGSGTVSVIFTPTNAVVATIPVGPNPFGVALNPAGTRAYVTNTNNPRAVYVINSATNTVITTVATGNGPQGIAVNPQGTRAYVASVTTATT